MTIHGVAIALLMSSAAVAQSNPLAPGEAPPAPAIDQIAPSAEAPLLPSNPQPGDEAAGSSGMDHDAMMGSDDMMDDDDEMDSMRDAEDRRGWRGRGHGRHGYHARHWRNHHGRHGDGDRGAVLSFSQGNGGPSFRIRCAEGDTSLECASAMMPIIDRLMPQQAPAAR
jgi:hypothetical protein